MCPTTLGRIHTRVATLVFLPLVLGLILWAVTGNPNYVVLLGIYLLLGVALDVVVYAWAIKYQPPWMTFVLALAELGLLYATARVLHIDLTTLEAIAFFWAAWLLAVGTKIVLLPIVSLTYLESAGEFRREQWSIPPELALMPILPSAGSNGTGALVNAATRTTDPEGHGEARSRRLILVEEGVDSPREYALRAQLTIGRSHCDVTIDDPTVERHHAVIEHFSSGFAIRPLHAAAAVMVNDEPVMAESVLSPGDCITIGHSRLRVEADAEKPVPGTANVARGDVPAPEPVPEAVAALVDAADALPSGEFSPPGYQRRRRRRGSEATRGYATIVAFLIVFADAIGVVIYLAHHN
jgi:prepilin signal peptidase PulO-like enzyme (type II secretory pathway)